MTVTNTMTLKKRNELRSLFKNKSRLSETHFAELIYSTLNKREDQFHGVWRAGQTYQKGDVVYYEGALWEMQSDQEICGKEGSEVPGQSDHWKSLLKDLENRVDQLQQKLDALCKDFNAYQQKWEHRWKQIERSLFILMLGLAITFLWLLGETTRHFWTGS